MNLTGTRRDMIDNYKGKKDKQRQSKENYSMIEKIILDVIKTTGDAVLRKALDDLMSDFEKGL